MDALWLLVIVIVCILLQAGLYLRLGKSGIAYERHFSVDHAFAGDDVTLTERVSNERWFPIPWLRVESMYGAGISFAAGTVQQVQGGQTFQYHHSVFSVPGRARIVRQHTVHCARRGVYGLDEVSLSQGDLVGLTQSESRITCPSQLVVYPALVALAELAPLARSWQGDVTVRRFVLPDPYLVSGTREYRPGDPLRSIHWKASARAQTLQVMQYECTADPKLLVVLNMSVTSDMWDAVTDEALIERGLSYAATLACEGVKRGVSVGFACNAPVATGHEPVVLLPAGGPAQLHTVLHAMAHVQMRTAGSVHGLLRRVLQTTTSAVDVILISAPWDPPLAELARQFQSQGHTCTRMALEAAVDTVQGA